MDNMKEKDRRWEEKEIIMSRHERMNRGSFHKACLLCLTGENEVW